MSSPITIPRTPSPATSRSPSGSLTGVYVPVHKRRVVDPEVRMASHAGSAATEVMNGHPIQKQPSFVYQVNQLRALAASRLVGVSPAQQSQLEELRAFISPRTESAPNNGGAGTRDARRRRAGRRASNAKKLQTEVHVDVESRRRRHGAWGWAAHEGAGESWRHPDGPVAVEVRA
ncbi:hypothetical protein DAEQUDRAFT_726943 [Daedalea quercina L-15889]|uniref:Uncharacterized protein n=1 Tax=Daedalea quercina L-15889 TaxID=1314783 RepID=A0A165Q6X1_9APHY|nr:hypothetical protein DAEQUDRAFT_726943 [Daedalea quercina L-15889]